MRCDQCEALMINGIFCHETGCPNTNSRYDEESGTWIKQSKCDICGYNYDANDICCDGMTGFDEEEEEAEEIDERHYYLSVRHNVNKNGLVTTWQIVDHGLEHSDYFQGCGTAFTPYEHVSTGTGDDATEALDDALESMAQGGHTVSKAAEKRMQKEIGA